VTDVAAPYLLAPFFWRDCYILELALDYLL